MLLMSTRKKERVFTSPRISPEATDADFLRFVFGDEQRKKS
jgi:hypothetical protein